VIGDVQAVWLLGGGPMQIIMAREIKRRGFRLIVSDKKSDSVCATYADLTLPIDTMDVSGHLAKLEGVSQRYCLAGIVSFAHDAHFTAAALASKCQLPTAPLGLSNVFRSKSQQREMLRGVGLRQPRSSKHLTPGPALRALLVELKESGSALLKWDSSSGSRGLELVNDHMTPQSLDELVRESVERAPGAVVVEERLIPETRLGTSEQSAEFAVIDGTVQMFNAVDRVFGIDLGQFDLAGQLSLKPGVEFGHVNPSSRPATYFSDIQAQVQRVIDSSPAARSGSYILKVDAMATNSGPVILEMTLRSSGGWDSSGSTPARGGRMHDLALDLALGIPVHVDDYRATDRQFVAVATTADGTFVDCIGRQFAIGTLQESPSAAMDSALQALLDKRFL